MANSDLEKYAKALDRYVVRSFLGDARLLQDCSAIMKYHSLKMEEVNETMRHLWNKTYQGTGTCVICRSNCEGSLMPWPRL